MHPNIQSAEKRIRNFNEVSAGFSKREALDEARRCPPCHDPECDHGCPLKIDIPKFVRYIRENDPARALEVIRENNPFPGLCGRMCPAPCEKACTYTEQRAPIRLRALERFASDTGRKKFAPGKRRANPDGPRVAVIGSGPAGMTAAAFLARTNYQVTIFESFEQPGGVARYGIPELRLPDTVLDSEFEYLNSLGVEVRTGVFVGRTLSVQELWADGFKAVLLASGAGVPTLTDLPGAHLDGIFYAQEFLMRVNLMKADRFPKHATPLNLAGRVAVIGAGYAALDCARLAVRFGKETTLIFEETQDEMRAGNDDRALALEEGVKFEALSRPLEILAGEESRVRGVKCVRLDFAESGSASGAKGQEKWKLKTVPDSEFVVEAETLVLATRHQPDSYAARTIPNLKLNKNGTVRLDRQGKSSVPGIFACGNLADGHTSMVEAMASGKKAAADVHAYFAQNV